MRMLSFEGRLRRKTYWIAIAPLIVVSVALSMLVEDVYGAKPFDWSWLALVGIDAILIWPMASVLWRRINDYAGSRAPFWVIMACSVASIALHGSGQLNAITDVDDHPLMVPLILIVVVVLIPALVLIALVGVERGTPGPNVHGPDPRV